MKNKNDLIKHLQDDLDVEAAATNYRAEQDERPERVAPQSAQEVIGDELDDFADDGAPIKLRLVLELPLAAATYSRGLSKACGMDYKNYVRWLILADVRQVKRGL